MAWAWPFGNKAAAPEGGAEAKVSSGCPIMHSRGDAAQQAPSSEHPLLQSACPVAPGQGRDAASMMILLDPRMDRSNNMIAGGESQHPGLGQTQMLPTGRVTSNIPRSDEHKPAHQDGTGSSNWVYPSPQMFFNAMQRKGWSPREEDMPTVVAIHNAVNERAWGEVLKWERMHCESCSTPKLVKFVGRPKDFSPQARFNQLMGYTLPFDRHDWTVDRCGAKVRYVIDFYRYTTNFVHIYRAHTYCSLRRTVILSPQLTANVGSESQFLVLRFAHHAVERLRRARPSRTT